MANDRTSTSRRTKGDGAIFKNNKGRWVARYKIKGSPVREFYGNSKAEAKAKLDEHKYMVHSGEAINNRATVGNYSDKFLYYKMQQVKRNNLKPSTYDRLESTYNCYIANHPISKILIGNLKSSDIQKLIDGMQADYSISTISKVYLFLHSMIRHGKNEKDLPDSFNPFSTVELPDESAVGVKTKSIQIIPDEHLDLLKEIALSRDDAGHLCYRYGPAIVFALNTGLREGEVLALSKNGIIHGENGRTSIRISETVSIIKNRDEGAEKNYKLIITPPKYPRSNRIIPLNQEALHCLNIMLDTYGINLIRKDLIISTNTGNIPTARNYQLTLDRILSKCGIEHYGTHALRHSFATKLLSKTTSHQDIKAVAELLGDDYKIVIKTYLHTDDDKKHDLVDLLNM